MKDTISEKSKAVKACMVRFVRPIKMGGRWYQAGEEVRVSATICSELVERKLAEKLVSSPSRKRTGKGDRDALPDG